MFRLSKQTRRKIRYAIVYRFVRLLIAMSRVTPRIMWLKLCGLIGVIAYPFAKQTRTLIQRHLAMAYKSEMSPAEVKMLSKKVFRYLAMNTGEMLRATRIETWDQLAEFLEVTGYENFTNANARGKGVIFLTCHLGAFDLQVSTMALKGLNPNIIGTPLKDERLNELLWNYRNKYGAVAIERGRETFRLIKVLKSGGSVALLIDQDTRVKSTFVDFFGIPASTPVGVTVLALKTGAAVVPTYIYLGQDWKQHMVIMPEVQLTVTGDEDADINQNTQMLTTLTESIIRQHPEQWVWMHERWKTRTGDVDVTS